MTLEIKELSKDTIVDFIENIFIREGASAYLGEACTTSDHMLQGAQLALDENAEDELVAAALLHDIGHFTNAFPHYAAQFGQDNLHEDAGADLLKPFFPPRVVNAVRNHVAAKRYLCAVEPDYYNRLSYASKESLALQGGPMTSDEVTEFESYPHYLDAVAIRRWDDIGKAPDKPIAPFSEYRSLLQRLVDKV